MKRISTVLGVFFVALVAVPTVPATTRSVADPRGDFKGSDWPGPGTAWSVSQGCWVSTQTGTCDPSSVYFENAGGLLDIVRVRHGHRARLLTHRLVAARRWDARLLSREIGGQISFYFNTDRDRAFERRLDVVRRGSALRGIMRNARGRRVGTATARRPTRASVELAFPRRLLGHRVRRYRWFAFAGVKCRRAYNRCGDRAPNARLTAHRLG
ncbi:MAG: hypothetical protein M3304_11350 [Actinomycetota bacterium]|nr:hypothetical protein [Actinomycetota bacterium]